MIFPDLSEYFLLSGCFKLTHGGGKPGPMLLGGGSGGPLKKWKWKKWEQIKTFLAVVGSGKSESEKMREQVTKVFGSGGPLKKVKVKKWEKSEHFFGSGGPLKCEGKKNE